MTKRVSCAVSILKNVTGYSRLKGYFFRKSHALRKIFTCYWFEIWHGLLVRKLARVTLQKDFPRRSARWVYFLFAIKMCFILNSVQSCDEHLRVKLRFNSLSFYPLKQVCVPMRISGFPPVKS